MGQNKAQKAATARAKKTTAAVEPAAVAEQPKPEVKATAPATPAQPSKQQTTIEKLTVALREQRQIEVVASMLTQDGKYINLLIGKEWPVIQIGASGGIVLPQIKSYPKAFEAALQGDKLLTRQNERQAKKATATAPAQPKAPAAENQTASA